MAAALDPSISFVASIVSSTLPLVESLTHEMSNTALQNGLTPEEILEMHHLRVHLLRYVETGDWKPLKTFFARLNDSTWSTFAKSFPQDSNHWKFTFLKNNYGYDPLQYYRGLNQNIFLAFSSQDEYDNVPVYESIFRILHSYQTEDKTNYEIHIYDAPHSLRDTTGKLLAEYKSDLLQWLLSQ